MWSHVRLEWRRKMLEELGTLWDKLPSSQVTSLGTLNGTHKWVTAIQFVVPSPVCERVTTLSCFWAFPDNESSATCALHKVSHSRLCSTVCASFVALLASQRLAQSLMVWRVSCFASVHNKWHGERQLVGLVGSTQCVNWRCCWAQTGEFWLVHDTPGCSKRVAATACDAAGLGFVCHGLGGLPIVNCHWFAMAWLSLWSFLEIVVPASRWSEGPWQLKSLLRWFRLLDDMKGGNNLRASPFVVGIVNVIWD